MSKFTTPVPPGGPRALTAEEKAAHAGALEEGGAEEISDAEEVRQFEESELEKTGEPWSGYMDTAVDSILAAGAVAAAAPEGMPYNKLTAPQRADYLWRSLTGQAGAAQREVGRAVDRDVAHRAATDRYRGDYYRRLADDPQTKGKAAQRATQKAMDGGRYSSRPSYSGPGFPRQNRMGPDVVRSAQEAANLKTQTHTARQIKPAPGPAVTGTTAMAAILASAAPAHFIAGEGRGSFADTQTLEGQVGALARFNEGPLGVDGLNDKALNELARDPEAVKKLKEANYIKDEVIDEIYHRREKSMMTEEYRRHLMQKYHTETDPIMKEQYLQMVRDAE